MIKIEYVSESDSAVIAIMIDGNHISIDQSVLQDDDADIRDSSRYYLDPLTNYIPL